MKTKFVKRDLTVFEDKTILEKSLLMTKTSYRIYDPGSYLYRKVSMSNDRIDESLIELIYVTLSAWNMNSRGAKLQEYNVFKKSIMDNEDRIDELRGESICLWSDDISERLKKLYMALNLVAEGKPLLVTFSKTMHFLLPKLIVPIDRKYTLNYYFSNINVPTDKEKQYMIFEIIQKEFSKFSNKIKLDGYLDNVWNIYITKIMDNMVIGFNK